MGDIKTTQYIRKPLYVGAVRVTEDNFDKMAAWCQGVIQHDESPDGKTDKKFIWVRVNNPKNIRQTKAFVGDWLLYTERGYKVYSHRAFLESFDEVQSNGNGGISADNHLTVNKAIEMLRDGRLALVPAAQQGVEAEELVQTKQDNRIR